NREIVRVRPFIRVAGNLSLSASELSANIPAFNAQKMAARSEGIPVSAQDAAGAEPDAEVSFITRDLNSALPRGKIAAGRRALRARRGSPLHNPASSLALGGGRDCRRCLARRGARAGARGGELGRK